MDVEAGRSSESQALVPAAKQWRRKPPNYRRRVRTRGSPRSRIWLVLITFVVLITTSWVIIPSLGMSGPGMRRRLSGGGLCTSSEFEDIGGGVLALIIYITLLTSLFVGLAGVTDDYFVPALVVISDRLNLSEDVAGATFMAAGSSAPELFTSLADTLWTEESNIGIGTIVGSAVFNILVIIACAGAFAPKVLNIDWRPFTRDICFYCSSIIFLFIVTYWDGSCGVVTPLEGFLMFGSYFLYILFMAYNESFMGMCTDPAIARAAAEGTKTPTSVSGMPDIPDSDNLAEPPKVVGRVKSRDFVSSMGKLAIGSPKKQKSAGAEPQDGSKNAEEEDGDEEEPTCLDCLYDAYETTIEVFDYPWKKLFASTLPDVDSEELRGELLEIMQKYKDKFGDPDNWEKLDDDNASTEKSELFEQQTTKRQECMEQEEGYTWAFTMSIIWIGTISSFMVLLAERCGCIIGIPSAIMGVTVLAAGTSIPDALGSILAAKSEQGDMAVANAIGSNVFDILIGLGLPYGIYGVSNEAANLYGGYRISMDGIIAQMAILFVTVVATFLLFMIFRWKLTTCLGYCMLGIYAAFCVYSVVTANNPRWYADTPNICVPTPA